MPHPLSLIEGERPGVRELRRVPNPPLRRPVSRRAASMGPGPSSALGQAVQRVDDGVGHHLMALVVRVDQVAGDEFSGSAIE